MNLGPLGPVLGFIILMAIVAVLGGAVSLAHTWIIEPLWHWHMRGKTVSDRWARLPVMVIGQMAAYAAIAAVALAIGVTVLELTT